MLVKTDKLDTVVPELRTAEEFLLQDDEDFVAAIYWIVLGREPDNNGLLDNMEPLRAGVSRASLLYNISRGDEAKLSGFVPQPALSAGWNDPSFRAESFLLQQDTAFIRVGFKTSFGREPAANELDSHLEQLRNGRSRWEALDIMRKVGLSGLSHFRGAEEFLLSGDEAFVRASYLTLLGRTPDEEGLHNHVAFLQGGVDRWDLLRGFAASAEGQAHAPDHVVSKSQAIGSAKLSAEEALLQTHEAFLHVLFDSLLAEAPSAEQHAHFLKRLQAGESRWGVLVAVSRSNVLAQQAAAAASKKNLGVCASKSRTATTFILLPAHHGSSMLVRKLIDAWITQGYPARFVIWNADARRLEVAGSKVLQRLNLLGNLTGDFLGYRAEDALELPIERSSCNENDWLFVPESFRDDAHGSRLVEMDVIVEARRLGLRSVFIFHGSEPLRSATATAGQAALHEHYMQALLLADLVITVNVLAADDLKCFFAQHQKANSVPLVTKISLPVGVRGNDDREQWSDFVRKLRGSVIASTDVSHRLEALYYYVDPSSETEYSVQSSRLASAFHQRGVRLIPVKWDHTGRRLTVCGEEVSRREAVDTTWTEWIAPASPSAPRWIFFPNGVDQSALAGIVPYARSNELRIAMVLHDGFCLHDGGEPAARSGSMTIDVGIYAKLDKVFCSSSHCLHEFSKELLAWRGKVSSAEHRFKVCLIPNELPRQPKRVVQKPVVDGHLNILIHVGRFSDASPLLEAAAEASHSSNNQLSFVFLMRSTEDGLWSSGHTKLRLDALPNTSVVVDPAAGEYRALLDHADIIVAPSPGRRSTPDVTDGLWCGLPCVVYQNNSDARVAAGLGTVAVNLHAPENLSRAILRLTDPTWRGYVSEEAISIEPRLWSDYARDVAAELMTDRSTDTLHVCDTSGQRDIYKHLPNLKLRPKLSLCISTYKRARWLELNLQNIFNQISKPRHDLEILVVDNASPDGTAEVVIPYNGRPDFRYHRNPVNVGMLGNLAVTAQMARGEYIWIIGDDDFTRPGVIQRVLDLLYNDQDLQLIYMNYGFTAEQNPQNVKDLASFLNDYNLLEPSGQDQKSTVKAIAAKSENFYTAIYCHIYRRDHALRSYCQDTSGRIFSTMANCIPTTLYVLSHMADAPAYWIGEPALVVNSNVSWVDYASLFELEQFPRAWDLAERTGSVPAEIDRRRGNRLWMIEMMWEDVFGADKGSNGIYISAPRVLMRLKHLKKFDDHLPKFRAVYQTAYDNGHPVASMPPKDLFAAFGPT